MGHKLMWAGLTAMMALNYLLPTFPWQIVGALLMTVGLVLYLIDK